MRRVNTQQRGSRQFIDWSKNNNWIRIRIRIRIIGYPIGGWKTKPCDRSYKRFLSQNRGKIFEVPSLVSPSSKPRGLLISCHFKCRKVSGYQWHCDVLVCMYCCINRKIRLTCLSSDSSLEMMCLCCYIAMESTTAASQNGFSYHKLSVIIKPILLSTATQFFVRVDSCAKC